MALPGPFAEYHAFTGLRDPRGVVGGRARRATSGFSSEDRPFHAHLTLARLRRGGPPAALTALVEEHAAAELGPTVVREVVLFESNLLLRGSAYVAMWPGPLNPGGRREA